MLLTVVCVCSLCKCREGGWWSHCLQNMFGRLSARVAIQTSSSSPPVFPSKLPLTGGSVESEPQLWVHDVGIPAWPVPCSSLWFSIQILCSLKHEGETKLLA